MNYREIPKYENPKPLDRSDIPQPVFEENPSLVEFYWLAWQQAWNHLVSNPDAPQSPYLDEGCTLERIWIWDTCLMALFVRYAGTTFPGVESLDNFYFPLHGGAASPLAIHHCDNPPLFAWAETENLRLSGNLQRIERLIRNQCFLIRHFEYFDQLTPRCPVRPGSSRIALERTRLGYRWSGNPSGMDNTPRGRDDYDSILWLDALAQQALSAARIAELAELVDDRETAKRFIGEKESLARLLNQYYWDNETGCYFDIQSHPPHDFVKVLTPASYWPLLAGIASPEQAESLRKLAVDPDIFGGSAPWPSVARNDPYYLPDGRYWRGGIWLPTAYMAIKGLEQYGFLNEADMMAENLLLHMHRTWRDFSPHTIWEAYNPESPLPASRKKDPNLLVRPDFCGWSALGPISMFIENILGFHQIDAIARRVEWRLQRTCRHGLENLRFGDITCDIIWGNGQVRVKSNHPFELLINQQKFNINSGTQSIKLQ